MGNKLKIKALLILVITGIAFWFSYPPFNVVDKEGKIVRDGKLKLGLDLQGGMHMVLQIDTKSMTAAEAKDAPQRVLEILRNRIDQFGVVEPLLQLQGKDRIVIQLPGVTDRERAKGLVGKTAHLEFQIVSDDPELLKKALAGDPVPGYTLKYMKEKEKRDKEPVLVENKALVTGDMVADAFTDYETFGMPYVSLRLNPAGATTFENVTASNVGKRLAIVLDGEVYSAPVIRERIGGGSAQISGNFSMKEAQDLSLVLRSPLPAPVKIIEERSVGATLGSDSIEKGIRATLIGGLFVLVFMAVYYTVGGAIADVAVVLNILIITGFLGMFRATLSLPGIAGLVLTIGMAVDANVLIFERMREEHKLGKPIRATIAAGYDKAFLTIFDSNLTTLISALILFQFGTGPVRGFATTLSVGLIASMFTSLFVTRFIFDLFTQGEPRIKEIKMLQIIGRTNFDFMSFRKIAYTISLVVILVGLFAFWKRGEGMYGIDFRGGALQEFRFEKNVKIDEVRKCLDAVSGGATSGIQSIGGGRDIIIRSDVGITDSIIAELNKKFGNGSFEVMRVEEVGPAVGADLRQQAIKALFWAMIGICIYVGFRFEFRYAITSIIALLHDVLVCVGLLALTGREFSVTVIAAILTVVGYSINDTIVIFDRIREKKKFMRKEDDSTIFNTSINETLSRTILTSFTVIMVVLSLFFFGGEVINDFAFVLLVGCIAGSYSTVFVASPLLIDWPGKKKVVAKKH